jgi:ABC-2 type transport system permease protein
MTWSDLPAALPAPGHRRPRGLSRLCRIELLLFLREPAAMVFTMVLPLILLLFLGLAYGTDVVDGIRNIDQSVPQIVVSTAVNLGVLGVAVNISECRASGVLRRYRLAPVPMWWFWWSQVVVGLLMFAASTAVLLAVVQVQYGVVMASQAAFALAVLTGLTFTFSAGVLLGGFDLPTRSVQIVGTVLFFIMFLGSGAALPRSSFPRWLELLSAANPMTPVVEAAVNAYVGRPITPQLPQLALVLLEALLIVWIAGRRSAWEANR